MFGSFLYLPLFAFFQNLAFKVLAFHVQNLQLVLAGLSSHELVFLVPWPRKALSGYRGCQNAHKIVQLEHGKPEKQHHDQHASGRAVEPPESSDENQI